jgi:hypothetical protein
MRLEVVEIEEYRAGFLAAHGPSGFKRAVVAALERRRHLYRPSGRRLTRRTLSEGVASLMGFGGTVGRARVLAVARGCPTKIDLLVE